MAPGVLEPDAELQALEDAWVLLVMSVPRKCSALVDEDGNVIQAPRPEDVLHLEPGLSGARSTTCAKQAVAVVGSHHGQWFACDEHLRAVGVDPERDTKEYFWCPILEHWRRVWLANDDDLEAEQERLLKSYPELRGVVGR